MGISLDVEGICMYKYGDGDRLVNEIICYMLNEAENSIS